MLGHLVVLPGLPALRGLLPLVVDGHLSVLALLSAIAHPHVLAHVHALSNVMISNLRKYL